MAVQNPHDLAVFVFSRINQHEKSPSVEILDVLFQTLFLASLKTEEGTPIVCSLAFVDSKNPDPNPPERLRDPRWRYIPFENSINFEVNQITKVALATDPTVSSLAVHPEKNGMLKIHGLVDQQGRFQLFQSHESESGWYPPGIFQALAVEPGHIIVTSGLNVIAELNNGVLIEQTVDVFEGMNIQKKMLTGYERRMANIIERVNGEGYGFDIEDKDCALDAWFNIIRRILLRARNIGHGGAFIISDSDYTERLRIKYKIHYDRLPVLFENLISSKIIYSDSSDLIYNELDQDSDFLPTSIFLDNVVANDDIDDADDALQGTLDFIASLSRVDGLVLLDSDFIVHGFGCEIITSGDSNCLMYQAHSASPSKGKVSRLNPERFGTRHRSMLRYCSDDASSVGFVVSNDGPVRAISRSRKNVYLWDNVQLVKALPFKNIN